MQNFLETYPSIEELASGECHYILAQKAMARFLGVTKQTVSRKLKFHAVGAPYKILHKHCITKSNKAKAVPVRYYELDVLYQIAANTNTANALNIVDALKNHHPRRNIAQAIIGQNHIALVCLD